MDQKGHIIDQKGLKMYEKKQQKIEFSDPKTLFLAEFSLAELGGYPNHCAQKSLAERGGYPPPLTGKIRYVVFEGLPKLIGILLHILPFDH